jgi:hypothetical protein
MELLAIWQRGFLSGVCFALSEMGVEGAGGGFIGERGCWGCGVVVMEQVTRGSRCDKGKGTVAGDDGDGGCAAKGGMGGGSALQRGRGAGTCARGTGEWWGQ